MKTPDLPALIEKLRALSEKATKGPWSSTHGNLIRVMQKGTGVCIAGIYRIGRARDCPEADGVSVVNAQLIVASVNFVRDELPSLLERISSLEVERDRAFETLEEQQALAIKAGDRISSLEGANRRQDQRIRKLEAALRVAHGYVLSNPSEQAFRDLVTLDVALGLSQPSEGGR